MRWLLLAVSAVCFAQSRGTVPKPDAGEYEVHGRAGEVAIGAEYMIHSFSAGEQTYLAADYLVVEVALYPPKGDTVHSRASDFTVRINGKRSLAAASPQMAATIMARPEYQPRPHLEASAGMGNAGVILGRPPQSPIPGRPPGDGTAPTPPRAPDAFPVDRPEPERASDVLLQTALPEGEFSGPVSGYLFFPYKGKPASVKSLELVLSGLTLRLK